MSEEMEKFIENGELPEWYEKFKENNKHLLSDDGKEFVFDIDNPLILSDKGDKCIK